MLNEKISKVKFYKVEAQNKFELMDCYSDPLASEVVCVQAFADRKNQNVFLTVGRGGICLQWTLYRENANSKPRWIVSKTIDTYESNVSHACLYIDSDNSQSLAFISNNKIGFHSLSDSPTSNSSSSAQKQSFIQKSFAKTPLRLFSTSKYIIICYKKLFVLLSIQEDYKVVASEPMQHIYDCCLLDKKSIALSCKVSDQLVVLTYSLDSRTPTSSVTLRQTPRILFPLLIG